MKYNLHQEVGPNDKGRDFVVGDLHGHYEDLMLQLKYVKFDYSKDRLFCVGDLIDRGPDSLKCLNLLYYDWFYCTLGNHEQFLIDTMLFNKSPNIWMANGGKWASMVSEQVLKVYANLLVKLPVAITIDNKYGICHAEPATETTSWLDYANSDLSEDIQEKLWGRYAIRHSVKVFYNDIIRSYHGHTPLKNCKDLGQARFIDTGACFPDGRLTLEEIK